MKLPTSTAIWAISTSLFGITAAIVPARLPHQPLGNGTKLLSFNETVTTPAFGASSLSVSWLEGGEDGQYIYQATSGALILENFVTGENSTFVAEDKIPSDVHEYWIRPDLEKVLFATNYTKQYRYSYFADYSVLDVASGVLSPLVADQAGDIQYAELAPVGEAIAFVRGNNLYLSKNGTVTQITSDGGPDLFHGVPDWVYEEEVFGAAKAFWFSPDGQVLAFMSFNETGVGTFTVPYYTDSTSAAPSYPRELHLRYPKVGTKNPTVELSLLFVDSGEVQPLEVDAYEPEDLIIGEVVWPTEDHSSVLYRAFNRVQDHSKHVRIDVATSGSYPTAPAVIRERDGSDGWLENDRAIQYIGAVNGSSGTWYIDVSDESGWQHIYLYPVSGGAGVQLTTGEWEVTGVLKVDTSRQLIYYVSTEHHSTERHLYSVSYTTKQKTALVDDSVAAYWSASFSSGGTYYILSYQGPDVPYQELYSVNSTSTPIRTITSNQALWTKLQGYALPNITYLELERPDGYSLNVFQRLPPNFDPSKQYPALFIPYGGPAAQEVHKRFQALNWKAYITCDPELEYITYTVDGRGTGYKGRKFRATVASQLGKLETEDQIFAAKELAAQYSYIDASKIGIFGWSYGGYLSAKVVEADSGVFSLGLIVAPVTDWRLYDSIYTERYQKTNQTNPTGYNETAVRKTDGFKNIAGGFTILHGLGDDNVHYQNSASLIDSLVRAGVSPSNFEWRSFTDSDHSINYHGATAYLYKYLTSLLYKEKKRTGQSLTHQWSRRKEATEEKK